MSVVCCFCGNNILRTDMDPLNLDIHSQGKSDDYREGSQSFHCHAICFEKRLYDKEIPFIWFSEDPGE